MSDSLSSSIASSASAAPAGDSAAEAPSRVFLVAYPKIVFLYPTLLASLAAALVMSFVGAPLDPGNRIAVVVGTVFLAITLVNLVILAFDFPRTTSLTLFFFAVALVLGFVLLVKLEPGVLPAVTNFLAGFHPLANATFYWTVAGGLGVILLAVMVAVRFDYWEVRPNELLHHHGFLSNLERLAAPNLRIDKEINDVFEYLLLRSGRLIVHPSGETRTIVLENVAWIDRKEEAVTRMLGALQVQVRPDSAGS